MKHPCSMQLRSAAGARWLHAMKSPASLRLPSLSETARPSRCMRADHQHRSSPEPGAPTSRHIQPRCMHTSSDSSAPAWPASSCSAPPAPASPAQPICRHLKRVACDLDIHRACSPGYSHMVIIIQHVKWQASPCKKGRWQQASLLQVRTNQHYCTGTTATINEAGCLRLTRDTSINKPLTEAKC